MYSLPQQEAEKDLMRLVVLENNEISWDQWQKMPGRGAYVCQSSNCIKKLGTNGNLQHRLKREKIICSQELLKPMIDFISEDFK